MRDEADGLRGLGVGCNGLIRVFLQPLAPIPRVLVLGAGPDALPLVTITADLQRAFAARLSSR